MTFWFAYSAGLIFVGSVAMLSENVDKWFVIKTASYSLLAAYLMLGDYHFPSQLELIGYKPDPIALNYKSDPTAEALAASPGIDFNPTCGSGAAMRKTYSHTELAKNENDLKPHC